MQDRTINAALLVLRRRIVVSDGEGLEHVEALLALRGVPAPPVWPGNGVDAARHGQMKRLLLGALRGGPKTRSELAALVAQKRPDLAWVNLGDRTDKALRKLRVRGLAVRRGKDQTERSLWRLI